MKRIISLILAVMMLLSTFAGITFTASAKAFTGWSKVVDYWEDGTPYTMWYYFENDVKITGWKKIKGVWYYLNPDWDGEMVANMTFEVGNNKYLFKKSGAMLENGWGQDEYGDWFYAKKSGALIKGWQKIGGVWYAFDSDDCYMFVGVNKVGKKIYLFSSSGAWVENPKNGWNSTKVPYIDYDGKSKTYTEWCYYKNGKFATGWLKTGGKWYFFDKNYGNMQTGAIFDGKKYYFMNSDGALREKAGWAKVEQKWAGSGVYTIWYYTNKDGSCVKGWKMINGIEYYFDEEDCWMYYDGVYEIDGTEYEFDENGACLGEIYYL